MKRYSKRPFPPYNFIPGKQPHPEKEGGYHYENPPKFTTLSDDFLENPDFLFALDLYNHEYFWEAHVYLEGLWHQVRKTQDQRADFLKGFIKLCAAGVKDLQGAESAARGHERRAQELFSSLDSKKFSSLISLLVK